MTPASLRTLACLALLWSTGCAASEPPQPATLGRVDGERALELARRQVELGPRPAGSEALERLRELLTTELGALGFEVHREAFREETPAGPIDFANLWVELPGRESGSGGRAPVVVLLAHLDTKRYPFRFVGANDGASATALLVELARVLASELEPRPVTYRLVWVDGEEAVRESWEGLDNTYGSRHHVQQLQAKGELERVRACIVLDMIGDRDLSLVREDYSDAELLRLFERAALAIGRGDLFRGLPYRLRDDHQQFLAVGVPSLVLIDFDYGPDHSWWHTAEDTPDKLSAESLATVGELVLAALPDLERFALNE